MILYLYALVDGLDEVNEVRGILGEPLRLLTVEGLAGVGGECDFAPTLDAAMLAAQDGLVRALHARSAALLPMRFGAAFTSEQDAARAVKARAPALRARLDLVRGREQMTLRITGATGATGAPRAWPGLKPRPSVPLSPVDRTEDQGVSAGQKPVPRAEDQGFPGLSAEGSPGQSGTEYLAARAAKATPPAIMPILDAVRGIVRGSHVEPGQSAGVVATVYHLIDRGSGNAYRQAIDAARATVAGLDVLITGPAPCYAFA